VVHETRGQVAPSTDASDGVERKETRDREQRLKNGRALREGAAKIKCVGSEEAEPEEQEVNSVCKEFRDAPMLSSEENSTR
jgi:hypothetical protein